MSSSITLNEEVIEGEVWKFSDKEVLISEMDKISVLYAAIHCLKRMYYYRKEVHYCDYRLKISEDQEQYDKFKKKMEQNEKNLLFFASKLNQLNVRANQLGFEIPEKYEDVKSLLSQCES